MGTLYRRRRSRSPFLFQPRRPSPKPLSYVSFFMNVCIIYLTLALGKDFLQSVKE